MNEMQVFSNPEFGSIRTVTVNEEPWFVLKDVCEAFGETNYRRVAGRLEDDEKGVSQISTPGGKQNMTIVNESGLYSALFAMQPEKARGVCDEYIANRQAQLRQFKRWVTSEVLPSIRKHGAYMTPEVIERTLTDPDYIIQLATTLKEEQQKRKALEQQAAENRPKVLFADAVSASHTSILVGELAKLLRQNGVDIGQNRLFSWLRDNGYLIRRSGTDYNMPTQRSMEMGLFDIKETAITRSDGSVTVSKTVKVTGRGQTYFVDKFLGSQKQEPNITKAVMDRRVQVCRE